MTTLHLVQIVALAMLLVSLPNNNAHAFQHLHPMSFSQTTGRTYDSNSQALFMAKKKEGKRGGKGFGDAPPPTSKKTDTTTETTTTTTFSPMATKPQPKAETGLQASPPPDESDLKSISTSTTGFAAPPSTSSSNDSSDLNLGKQALERMRREQAEKKDAELRRVREMRDQDKLLQSSRDAAAIPERVAMRMGKRMLPFVGIPLFGSLGAFVAFWYLATYKNVEFEPAMVATTTIVILASGLLGITYSIVSASWDEDREGSFLGVEEFQKNVGNIKEGLERSKENLLLREKMAGLPEAEIEAAIAELEKREKRKQSFETKLSQELEK